MRRPAPVSLDDLKHPGPRARDRRPFRLCRADPAPLTLPGEAPLMPALASWIDALGFSSAVLDLSGLELQPFDYVMPDRAIDDRHAAWYSDTRSSNGARLDEAIAILGKRDGDWFAHIHAFWHESGNAHLGHLLPDSLTSRTAFRQTAYGIKGAAFEAAPDPETEFTLFRVKDAPADRPDLPPNALITTLAPFEDLYDSIRGLARELDTTDYEVLGLDSLAGAEFLNSPAMTALISEILLQNGCAGSEDGGVDLPIRCVDLNGHLHQGQLQSGSGPTLVTCELLLRSHAPDE